MITVSKTQSTLGLCLFVQLSLFSFVADWEFYHTLLRLIIRDISAAILSIDGLYNFRKSKNDERDNFWASVKF